MEPETPPALRPQVVHVDRLPEGVPPEDIVYVGPPGPRAPRSLLCLFEFSSPFSRSRASGRSARQAVRLFRSHLASSPRLAAAARRRLRGKHLACVCAPGPCHARVLLAEANRRPVRG